jgi:hypothetical protein
MPEQLWLFDRIFRQPPTHFVLPTENLTTEILAFFLEHFHAFRKEFLARINPAIADLDGTWHADTQKPLVDNLGIAEWHRKIPDIRMINNDHLLDEILIEVKVDAGGTYCGDDVQTKFYRSYVNDRGSGEVVLVSRRSQEEDLKKYCKPCLLFKDVAEMLLRVPNGRHDSADQKAIAILATRWAEFIRQQRWIMAEITNEHFRAIADNQTIKDRLDALKTQALDILDEVLDRARSCGWCLTGGRDDATWELRGYQIWANRKLREPEESDADVIYIACHCAFNDERCELRALWNLRGKYAAMVGEHPQAPIERIEHDPWSPHRKILLGANVLERFDEGGLNADCWTRLRDDLEKGLGTFKR